MPTVQNLRKLLDRKQWEGCNPDPTINAAGHIYVQTPPRWPIPMALAHQGASIQYLYLANQDAWQQIPGGTLGANAVGTCGAFHPSGPTGTASAGSSTTVTTVTTLNSNLAGTTIRITSGTGAGQERVIASNTVGANSVVTTTAAWTVQPDATSGYLFLSGRFWILGATGAAVVWRYYDFASNTWTARSVVSGPGAAFGTDGACEATAGALQAAAIASGTATAGAATSLSNSGKAWTVNQWAFAQVRITGGTGAGQVRTINSNTGTALTVSAAWGTNPDATSVYVIEGNDDWLYVAGGNAVTLFRYAIAGISGLTSNAQLTADTWITVVPVSARGGAGAAGLSLNWISASASINFATENTIRNGQRIYSFRGGTTATLDYYDIAANTWVSGVAYNHALPTFALSTSYVNHLGFIYIQGTTVASTISLFYRYDVAGSSLEALTSLLYTPGGAVGGGGRNMLFSYVDGITEIQFLYNVRNAGTELFRMMLI